MQDDALPPDVAQAIAESQERKRAKVAGFATFLAGRRDEAVKARAATGIEAIWTAAEEAYLGIDDLNRHEWAGQNWATWIKSPSPDGGLRRRDYDDDGRATAYPRVTARYVDAGAAKVSEILIPIDGKTFALKPTPVPDLVTALEDETPVAVDGQPVTRPPRPDEAAQAHAQGEDPQPQPLTVKDLAENAQRLADEAAESASDQVHDWLTECRHPRTLRKAIFDGARLGTMIVAGPMPAARKAIAVKTDGGISIEAITKIVPESRWVNPWNFYPAPDCGEDATSGSYVLEKDDISARTLMDLIEQPGYMAWAIEAVLKEGPEKCNTQDWSSKKAKPDQYTIWHYYGVIKAEELKLCNPELWARERPKGDVYGIVSMVNDTPIKVAINPLKTGRFPHKVAVWRRRAGCWAGQGIAEQMKTPQAIITGATRAMLNNGGKSAGSQIVMDNELVIPADGSRKIYADKLWHKAPEAAMEDVRKAFAVFTIPNVTPQLMAIIEYGFKLAEESTSIPLITQGQSGKTTPDTFGGMQLQDNNANQLLRDIGFAVAEDITEPLVRDFYEWLLLDPSVPDGSKGDFQVDVSGSVALIEKAIQDQTIMMMAPMVDNPKFGIDPEKWLAEFLRSKRLNPASFVYDETRKQELETMPPPKAPQVEAAEIRAKAQIEVAKSRDELAAEKIRVDIDRDTSFVQSQERRDAGLYEARMKELELQRELADLKYRQSLLDYANRRQIALDQAKVELSKEAMSIRAQMALSGDDGKGPQVAEPAFEPEGRAPDDMAYQK